MLYDSCIVYGPYSRARDHRQHVVVKFPNGKLKSVSYPKFLIQQITGRILNTDETIHHLDGNPRNNNMDNLQILSRSTHAAGEVKRLKPQKFKCLQCGNEFTLSGIRLSRAISNRKRNKAGPFCCRKCSGNYGTDIQNKRVLPARIVSIDPDYTTKFSPTSLVEETQQVDTAKTVKP